MNKKGVTTRLVSMRDIKEKRNHSRLCRPPLGIPKQNEDRKVARCQILKSDRLAESRLLLVGQRGDVVVVVVIVFCLCCLVECVVVVLVVVVCRVVYGD